MSENLMKVRKELNPVMIKLLASKRLSDIQYVKFLLKNNIRSITSSSKITRMLGNKIKSVTNVTKISEPVRMLYSNFKEEYESLKVEAVNNSIEVAEMINTLNSDVWFLRFEVYMISMVYHNNIFRSMGFVLTSVVLLLLCLSLYFVSFYLSITNQTMEKISTYECGLEPIGNSRMKFDILYYVIGILYLIFDLEIIFLFPLATVLYSYNSIITIWIVLVFISILTIGFIYEWYQGALSLTIIYLY